MKDLYEQITKRLVEQLENGVVPWASPYLRSNGIPQNFSTGKEYRGINIFLLGSLCYTSPYFLTFLQAKQLGGSVRKGEHGHLVVKYGSYSKPSEVGESEDTFVFRGYLKGFTVFNSSQIEGISFPDFVGLPELDLSERTNRARTIINEMPNRPLVQVGSSVPCYRIETDSVHMPETAFFRSEEAYYSTLFHELAHSTGHRSRLSRKSLTANRGFGSVGDTSRRIYAEEELVAEIAASFVGAEAGIIESNIENSAAYLDSWIKALRSPDAKSWVVRAASQGQLAADFILGRLLEIETGHLRAAKEQLSFVERVDRNRGEQPKGR